MNYTAQELIGGIASGGVTLFAFVFFVICIIGWWKLFEKAGIPGVFSLIPVLNVVTLSKIAFGSYWYGILLFIPFVNLIYGLVLNYQVMRSFGCETALSILGAIFPVLVLIPAFGDHRYLGAKNSY